MMNKAPRPCEIEFYSGVWEGDDCFKVTFDANEFIKWCEKATDISGIFEITFKGYPIKENGELTTLGTVLYDACDYGLEITTIVGDALYEARHPWLDWKDALEKCLIPTDHVDELLVKGDYEGYTMCNVINHFGMAKENADIFAFKPIDANDFHYFDSVKVYQDA